MANYEGYEKGIAYTFWLGVIAYFGSSAYRYYEQLKSSNETMTAVKEAAILAWNLPMKNLFLGLDVFFGLIFLYVLYQKRDSLFPLRLNPEPSERFRNKSQATPQDPVVLKHWVSVIRRANTGTPENLRLAILEADSLVDTFLKRRGYAGDTFADRLKHFSPETTRTLDGLWSAHKIRNHIAHTPGFIVSAKEAEIALTNYKNFLKELGAF